VTRVIDLPEGAVQGDTLVANGSAWKVKKIARDGTGMVQLELAA